jgi:hypothetical protein
MRQSFGSLFDTVRFLRQALHERGFGLVELDAQMQHSLSPIDADTVMRHSHTSGSEILVNIAHIGKVKFCVWNVKLRGMLPLRE